nr:hypothetical protein CFP56_26444 [Quercus suber]
MCVNRNICPTSCSAMVRSCISNVDQTLDLGDCGNCQVSNSKLNNGVSNLKLNNGVSNSKLNLTMVFPIQNSTTVFFVFDLPHGCGGFFFRSAMWVSFCVFFF